MSAKSLSPYLYSHTILFPEEQNRLCPNSLSFNSFSFLSYDSFTLVITDVIPFFTLLYTWKTDYAVKGSTYTAPDSKSLIGKVYDQEYINFENFQNWICASSKDVKTLQPLETFTVNENVLFIANYSNYCTACYIVLYDHKLPFGITAIGTRRFINTEDLIWETGESNHYKVFPELTASDNYQWKVLVCDPDTLIWEQKAIMDIDEDFVEAAGGSSAIKSGSNIIIFPHNNSTFYLK